jgi:hypothetical protein
MLARGDLSPEAYQRVIETGDLPAETKKDRTQIDMVAFAIDSWLYDELEEISNLSPLPWMNLAGAIVQCLDSYMSALMDPKFPPEREIYFRRYITQCDALLKKQALSKAAMAGDVTGAPADAALGPVAATPG